MEAPLLSSSARLLKALSLLHSRRFWTGAELADALGVTERSVRRDIDALRELGYPVHAAAGVGGGYALGAGRDLPPLPLEDEEAIAVALGLRSVASGWVSGLEEAAITALSKLEAVLPKRLRGRLSDLSALKLAPQPGPRTDGGVLATLASACRAERLLAFDYRSGKGERTRRTAEPYRLVRSQGRWYLLAWDRDREDWRTFRVDRMGPEIHLLHAFRPRPLPAEDLSAYVARSTGAEGWRHRARLTVYAPAAEVAARIPAPYGHVTPIDEGRCTLETGSDDLGWLAAYLGLLGREFEVHEPPELVEHLRALSERFARATTGPKRAE